ncbi:hypothetical protein [Methylobacterium sp. J-076]|uniref:hypothetical protein n=1 Tax=Methylobacterium sp. J-076 TaxID=2836655 RepID=UPI001FBB9716|nr:hypothetical protein [Methylobacterium sp. J-076]MCJ2011486.1 hypothetical protein [Methylobacterium sp. J-076]
MSTTPTRSIALTRKQDAAIRAAVASGRGTGAREVVRAAWRRRIGRQGAMPGARPAGERRDIDRGSV